MSIDMFPDAAVQHIINAQEATVTDQHWTFEDTEDAEERIDLEQVPLVVEVNYRNADEPWEIGPFMGGVEPFIMFQMKQREGAVLLEVEASMIENEDELIETLEVFFETMLEERQARLSAATLRALAEETDGLDDLFDGSDMPTEPGEMSL